MQTELLKIERRVRRLTDLREGLDWKEVDRLKREWDIEVEEGRILENNRTGQWKVVGPLPPVMTLDGKNGRRLDFVCPRCKAHRLGFRKTTPAEEAAFNLSEVPDYSGGFLAAPMKIHGELTNRAFRCSCAVGRSLPAHIPFYDSQPEADTKATQEDLTHLDWKLRAEEEKRAKQKQAEVDRRASRAAASEAACAAAVPP
jgi:hypothetical protein